MHVGTVTFYLSLTLCGQLGSSNQSALFILSYQELVTYTLIIDLSVFTSDSALSFPVICVKSYIGSHGVLVPTGTVHSNNEFEFEFEFIYIYLYSDVTVFDVQLNGTRPSQTICQEQQILTTESNTTLII